MNNPAERCKTSIFTPTVNSESETISFATSNLFRTNKCVHLREVMTSRRYIQLPIWGGMEWKVIPLQSFSGREGMEKNILSELKKK